MSFGSEGPGQPSPDDLCAWLENRERVHRLDLANTEERFNKVTGHQERNITGMQPGRALVAECAKCAWGADAYAAGESQFRSAATLALQDPKATVRFDKRFTLGDYKLGGVTFSAPVALPPPIPGNHGPQAAQGAGAVVAEMDGRVWLCEPGGGFGGHAYVWPKGYHEGNDLANTASREVAEELGLQVRLDSLLGIFPRDAAGRKSTAFYLAMRAAGDPACAHWETFAVDLVPVSEAFRLLSNRWDRLVLRAALWHPGSPLRRVPHAIEALAELSNFLPDADAKVLVVSSCELPQKVLQDARVTTCAPASADTVAERAQALSGVSATTACMIYIDTAEYAAQMALLAASQAGLRCVALVQKSVGATLCASDAATFDPVKCIVDGEEK